MINGIRTYEISFHKIGSTCIIFTFLLSRLNPFMAGQSILFWIPIVIALCWIGVYFCVKIGKTKSIKFDRYIVWILLVSCYAALTNIWTLNTTDTNYIVITMLENIPVYLGIYLSINSKEELIYSINIYFMATYINAICYLMTLFIGENLEGRLGGAINANTVGLVMAFSIYLLVYYKKDLKNRKVDIVSIVSISFFLILLLLSGSKKGILILFLLFFIRQFLKNRNKMTIFIRYSILLFIFLLALRYIPLLYDTVGYRIWNMIDFFFNNGGSDTDYSTFQRLEMLKYGFQAFLEKPIIGYGINTYHILSSNHFGLSWFDTYSHCNYTEVLVSGGIVFALIYYSIYYKLLREGRKVYCIYIIVFPILISLIICEFAIVSYYDSYCQFLLCICGCVLKIFKNKQYI